jgi:hypothetical protein
MYVCGVVHIGAMPAEQERPFKSISIANVHPGIDFLSIIPTHGTNSDPLKK